MLEEINIANQNIDKYMLLHSKHDQSICSGFLGMLEIHDIINEKRNKEHEKLFQNYLKSINNVYNIKTGGWEKEQIITGLFYGLAGIGYNILKLDKKINLPSLLWL